MFERKIFKSNNGQWRITIPPALVRDLDLEHGEKLEVDSVHRGVDRPQIQLKKIENQDNE